MMEKNVFWTRGCTCHVPFQNPGTSKGMKKCLKAKRHSGQLACGSDNPLAPFNNIFPFLKKFHRIPSKSHATHTPSSRKIYQDIRSASCMFPAGSSVKQNRLKKRETARLESFTICKAFRRAFGFLQPVYSLTSPLKRPENSPISKYFLRGGRLWTVDFGGGLGKLGVPGRDVEAGGDIV